MGFLKIPLLFLLAVITISCSGKRSEITFNSNSLRLSLNKSGMITELTNPESRINYLSGDTIAPLMSLRINDRFLYPESATYGDKDSTLTLSFNRDNKAVIKIRTKKTHITFELLNLSNADSVDLVAWGPYPTTIREIIGETVGVVQGNQYSIGIQSLNPKTLGGYPWQENDCMPQIDIFEQDDYSDLSEQGKREVLYRVEAAKPYAGGSTLQAYCRNRLEPRVIENWGHEKYVSPVLDDGGVTGSKIALFGCSIDVTLETIEQIEIEEGLPHPMIDGQWGKTAPTASSAYIIMEFGEDNYTKALGITRKAGLRYLYHPEPFEYWGHFKLREDMFPNGTDGLKEIVAKAESEGVMIGVHTLSNFITTNDPYVTPKPDPRLAKVGSSQLTAGIDPSQTEISIYSPDFFNQFNNNNLKTFQIEDELIRYGSITDKSPWRLLDCQRGAFGTIATSHAADSPVYMLADHAYKVFLTDPELSIEVSKNIATLFNKTGLRQISFDGLEGNRSTGLGNYGEIRFTKAWYDNLNEDVRRHYIADASRTSHYFWHIYSRMNWGEPWYAGFRESQTDYRIKNQKYFDRNMMPNMLGWFRMTTSTSVEDIEWMLARSAAFDAGYAFVTNFEVLESNGLTDKILEQIGDWEKIRLAGAFTEDQKSKMEDLNNEFHLDRITEDSWLLSPVTSYKYTYKQQERQPGEPSHESYTMENHVSARPVFITLRANNGDLRNIKFEIDSFKEVIIPITLAEGQILQYKGGEKAIFYNKNWRKIDEIQVDSTSFLFSKGTHIINFECEFTSGNSPEAMLEFRVKGDPERIELSNSLK